MMPSLVFILLSCLTEANCSSNSFRVASDAPDLFDSTYEPPASVDGLLLTATNPVETPLPLFIKAILEGLGGRSVAFAGSAARRSSMACFLDPIRCRNWRPLAATGKAVSQAAACECDVNDYLDLPSVR